MVTNGAVVLPRDACPCAFACGKIGERGGYVVDSGPPEVISKNAKSYTGKFLAQFFNGNGARPAANP